MTDRISSVTKALLTLCMFFICATIGAALALFIGWPVAILSGIVGFILLQQVMGTFARRRDKRAQAKEMAHLRQNYLQVETALHETRARLGELSGQFEERGLMMAAISHDLRTPLTRLRLRLETGEVEPGMRDRCIDDIREMNRLVESVVEVFRPERAVAAIVGAELPLEEAGAAHRLVEERKSTGKVVLLP